MENSISRTQSSNNIVLSGIVGDEKNIYRNQKGNMASFSFAHFCGKEDGGKEKTAWFKVKVFNTEKMPNDLSIISKGQKLIIEGRLDVENFTRKDGTPDSNIILVAKTIKVNVPVVYEAVPDYGNIPEN